MSRPAASLGLMRMIEAVPDLLAHCVSYGVNALYEKPNPYSGTGISQHGLDIRLAQADRLARSTGLDMVAVAWQPTVGNYLGRVSKPPCRRSDRVPQEGRHGQGSRTPAGRFRLAA